MAALAAGAPRVLSRVRALASSHEGVLLLILVVALILLANQTDRFLTGS